MALRVRVGDVVRLRSGGPDMTVESLRGGGLVDCVWFDEARKQTSPFFLQTLDHVSRAKQVSEATEEAEGEQPEKPRPRMVRKGPKGIH